MPTFFKVCVSLSVFMFPLLSLLLYSLVCLSFYFFSFISPSSALLQSFSLCLSFLSILSFLLSTPFHLLLPRSYSLCLVISDSIFCFSLSLSHTLFLSISLSGERSGSLTHMTGYLDLFSLFPSCTRPTVSPKSPSSLIKQYYISTRNTNSCKTLRTVFTPPAPPPFPPPHTHTEKTTKKKPTPKQKNQKRTKTLSNKICIFCNI